MKIFFVKISFISLILILIITGCENEKETSVSVCGIENPLSNLEWLRNLKTGLENDFNVKSAQIVLYRLDNSDYIYVQKSVASTYDLPNTIYDCEGNEKYKCGGNQPVDSCTTFFSEAQKIKILWEK